MFPDLEKKFAEPKVFLHNYFVLVANETKIPHCLNSKCRTIRLKKTNAWSFTYEINWPEHKSFTAVGSSKAATSAAAALKCLYWLHLNNRIKNRLPVIYEKSEVSSILNKPEVFELKEDVRKSINDFLEEYERVSLWKQI